MTTGQLLFYGGIAGIIISIILFVVTIAVFENKKRRFLSDMEKEY